VFATHARRLTSWKRGQLALYFDLVNALVADAGRYSALALRGGAPSSWAREAVHP